MKRERRDLVLQLIELREPINTTMSEFRSVPWDSEEPLIELQPHHVEAVLNRHIQGLLSDEDVEEWANALEGRDDVAVTNDATKDVLHILANPILEGRLSRQRAAELIQALRGGTVFRGNQLGNTS